MRKNTVECKSKVENKVLTRCNCSPTEKEKRKEEGARLEEMSSNSSELIKEIKAQI